MSVIYFCLHTYFRSTLYIAIIVEDSRVHTYHSQRALHISENNITLQMRDCISEMIPDTGIHTSVMGAVFAIHNEGNIQYH